MGRKTDCLHCRGKPQLMLKGSCACYLAYYALHTIWNLNEPWTTCHKENMIVRVDAAIESLRLDSVHVIGGYSGVQ